MNFIHMIVPSEILLIKVMLLGFFFGWQGRKSLRPKCHEIDNMKFMNMKEGGRFL